jgi:3-deoxy-manno-octulosonate cytidylyltransferase (CMP-KDO synthetase)
MSVIGIIPCRYASTRFPGKPLVDICGKPMMWHVYQRSIESNVLDEVYIATDDNRIKKIAEELNLNVVMTHSDHKNGTDRVAEVANKIESEYYVNIQGDEPLLDPSAIANVVNGLIGCDDSMVLATNACASVSEANDIIDTNVVKVILSANDNALAYSRLAIPFPKSGKANYIKQLGLYAFRKRGLQIYSEQEPGYLESTEGVEMYRLVEHGYHVKMIKTDDSSISVDTPDDLERVKKIMEQ